jgi:hypothetical protein
LNARNALIEAYGEDVMNQLSVVKWYMEFRGRRGSAENCEGSGRPRPARTVATVHCLNVQSATLEGLQ